MSEAKPTPGPWRYGESISGKWYIYAPDGRPIIVPNVSATNRPKEEIAANFKLIVAAVNAYRESWSVPTLAELKQEIGGAK